MLCLPALARLLQCVKRWSDTRLKIHLVNVSAIVQSVQTSATEADSVGRKILEQYRPVYHVCPLAISWESLHRSGILRLDIRSIRQFMLHLFLGQSQFRSLTLSCYPETDSIGSGRRLESVPSGV